MLLELFSRLGVRRALLHRMFELSEDSPVTTPSAPSGLGPSDCLYFRQTSTQTLYLFLFRWRTFLSELYCAQPLQHHLNLSIIQMPASCR